MVMESNDSLHNSLSDTYDDKLSSELQKKINYLNRHFIYFAVVASLNHALAYVVLAYASSLLDPELAGIILSLTWFLNAVSGFTVATFITRYVGYKIAMIISLTGYTIQIYTLYLSVLYPTLAWHVAITGAIISGFTSAIWWTAQGICFELTCQQLCQLYDADAYNLKQKQEQQHFFKPFEDSNIKLLPLNVISNINVVRSNLSAIWTLVYQIADIVVFLVLSIAPLYFNMTFVETLNCLVILGIITSILGLTFDSLGDKGTPMSPSQIMTSIISVPRQFQSDARASLLAPFVFGFGITTAMFAFFINGTIENTEPTIGLNHMGLLESYSYLVAVIVAFPYAYICTQYKHGSNFVIQFGSFSFMMCGIVSIMVNDKQISTWQCLLVLRTLYGMGRSVFEGACRAVYADLFRGDDLATAFSAQTLLTGLSGGICFFIFGSLSRTMISVITIVNGVVALVAYGVLMRRGERMGDPVSWSELCGCSTTNTATATTTHYNGHTHTHPDIQHYQAIND